MLQFKQTWIEDISSKNLMDFELYLALEMAMNTEKRYHPQIIK